ncbi:lipopolysaccharide-induced tumor necrosis factor-alpha factor homolog [Schistocerca piceifrons]|uniref:lipopolysaccharide-induced tumor necrosis factor-alpha factor homolog n=1 Tax=Schistocerca piceifrons TaxID=274613 RepID=UPI001F5FC9F7|nr:lipopolysaccharide-induced tumor necrosis factor-alpha factor homolog [Schistocerca piceifrons]
MTCSWAKEQRSGVSKKCVARYHSTKKEALFVGSEGTASQGRDDGVEEQKKSPSDQPPPYAEPQPQPAPPPSTANVQQPVLVATEVVIGPESCSLVCPFCHASVKTRVDVVSNSRTHCSACVLCLVGGLCCMWIPYCMDSCKSKIHYCPKCGAYIGTYDK